LLYVELNRQTKVTLICILCELSTTLSYLHQTVVNHDSMKYFVFIIFIILVEHFIVNTRFLWNKHSTSLNWTCATLVEYLFGVDRHPDHADKHQT
jgi:hypothetical protein